MSEHLVLKSRFVDERITTMVKNKKRTSVIITKVFFEEFKGSEVSEQGNFGFTRSFAFVNSSFDVCLISWRTKKLYIFNNM